MADHQFSPRYDRQILLPELGINGQALLQQAKVLVIGAGGLGCPALQYLVAAGVGTIGIADGDTIDINNLHRQVLYHDADISKQKAIVAKQRLSAQNPDCTIIAHPHFLQVSNAWDIIAQYEIVLDGSDNFSTRYLVNDICLLQNKPLVYGAVYRFEGQVAVFNVTYKEGHRSAQYRDLFPDPPQAGTISNCSTAGVLGILPGIIGTMQAAEVIKLITGIGKPLTNKFLNYNALTNEHFILDIAATENGRKSVPPNRLALENYDYNISCDMPGCPIFSMDVAQFARLKPGNHFTIVDVREIGETPVIHEIDHLKIPLSTWHSGSHFPLSGEVVFICQSGIRSRQAAQLALRNNGIKKAYSLEGGIVAWLAFEKTNTVK